MLVEELLIIDGDAALFRPLRPLIDNMLRLEHGDDMYSWHGWNRAQIERFLASLPPLCSLVVGVWESVLGDGEKAEYEKLALGCVCEIYNGEVRTIRTFEALAEAGLKA